MLIPIMSNGDVRKYTSVGSYPLFYITKDCGVLCPKCVQENIELCNDTDDPQWHVTDCAINWENESLYCDHCGEPIESAYGGDGC